jgi:Family of unknown function (DUF6308)
VSSFRIDPLLFIQGDEFERARKSLEDYQRTYTGRVFDRWTARTDPFRITEADILAVTTLSVDVHPDVAIWLLDDAADRITSLLTKIPPTATIWQTDNALAPDGPADELYWMLYERKHLKRTTASKLIAAKRPALLPIWDTKVAGAVFGGRDANDWQLWHERCAAPVGDELRLAVSIVNARTEPHLELLRAIDIVIWMRVWGYKPFAALPGPGERLPDVD